MKKILLITLLLFAYNFSFGQQAMFHIFNHSFEDSTSNVFLGTVNNLWSNIQNWSKGHIPTSTERARIHHYCINNISGAVCDEIYVDSGYTLDFNGGCNLTMNSIVNYGTINVTGSGSTLISNVDDTKNTTWGTINFASAGTMQLINDAGTTITLPNLDYYNLISGYVTTRTGTRILNYSTIIRGNLNTSVGKLIVNNDMTINGTTSWGGEVYGLIFNNSTITINGTVFAPTSNAVQFANCIIYANTLLEFRGYSGGNYFVGTSNTVYLRAGLNVTGGASSAPLGNGITDVICQNNNQTLSLQNASFKSLTIEGNININVTTTAYLNSPSINGTTSTSQLINKGTINYSGSVTPMSTGLLDCSTYTNTFNYSLNGSQNVLGGTYQNLTLSGTATPNDKTLQGNVSVLGTYSVSGNAVRVDNGFTFGNP